MILRASQSGLKRGFRNFCNNARDRNIMTILTERGFVKDTTSPTLHKFLSRPRTIYAGFDPTADGLHMGNLLVLMVLKHFQRCGHRPLCVVGGATGLIGDPSGRKAERDAMTQQKLDENITGIKNDISRFLYFSDSGGALLLNNVKWYKNVNFIDFLSDVGRCFRMASMLGRESVRQRLGQVEGMSYTYDFYHLHQEHDCSLQIGGSDQWGNITAGIDLVRRKTQHEVFGLTLPLLTGANGEKFGKSAGNALWLDPARTSPYALYQYFLGSADADVIKFLKLLTFLPLSRIEELEQGHLSSLTRKKKEAHKLLASTVTEMIHGADGLASALKCTNALFGGSREALDLLSETEVIDTFTADSALKNVNKDEFFSRNVCELAIKSQACSSEKEAHRKIRAGGLSLNNVKITDVNYVMTEKDVLSGGTCIFRSGKKNNFVLNIV